MSRKLLQAAKCSQMSNPTQGTGNGGDRCTEAVAAMIAKTYNVPTIPGFVQTKDLTGEQIMYWFTQMLNKGSNVSALEDAAWINRYMTQHNGPSITNIHGPTFRDITAMIDRGHIGIGGFNNYAALRLSNGSNPYKWTDPSAVGHVLLIVGYDDVRMTVIVHDPLRADPSGQPADYNWSSFAPAGFSDLSEVQGQPLTTSASIFTVGSGMVNAFFSPDDNVVNFCVYLDQLEQVDNPFNVSTPQDNISAGPINWTFSDPVSWAGAVGGKLWGDTLGIVFRLVIFAIGAYMVFRVVKGWLPESAPGMGQASNANASQLASLAMMA